MCPQLWIIHTKLPSLYSSLCTVLHSISLKAKRKMISLCNVRPWNRTEQRTWSSTRVYPQHQVAIGQLPLRPLYSREKSPNPLLRRLDGRPSQLERGGHEKNSCSCRKSNPGPPKSQHHWCNSPLWAIAILRSFCQICLFPATCRESDHPVFPSLDFAKIFSFTEQGRQPCFQPPTWRIRSLNLCLPVTQWPNYNPRHWVPFSSPSTTRRATVEVF
jgi:hypothetical protein